MKKIDLQNVKTEIARPNTIREINRQIVLNYVRDLAPISRAEIARASNLQRSTVSSIINALERSELVEDIGRGTSTGGRKPNLLRIRTGSPVALGVDLGPRKTNVAVADLAANVLEEVSFPTVEDQGKTTDRILESIAEFARKYSDHDLEVGVSVPGIVDKTQQSALYIPYFQWRDWELGGLIEQETGLPTRLDNDANSIALAELWFGRNKLRKIRNFIALWVAEGIGTGVVFEGQVYRGELGDAGEFGHMIVGEKAPVVCSCGSDRCWEAYASESATLARFRGLSDGYSDESVGLDQVIELAQRGSAEAKTALRQTAHFLGIGISNLIVGLGPQAVVVSGSIAKAWDLIEDELYSTVEKSIRTSLPKTVIISSSLGEDPRLTGAVSLVLARKFASAHK